MVGQEAAQERQVRLAPFGDPLVIVAIGDGATHDQQQHLRQRMGYTPLIPRVIDDRKMVQQQRPKARLLRREDNGDAHGGGSESMATNRIRFPASRKPPLTRVRSPGWAGKTLRFQSG